MKDTQALQLKELILKSRKILLTTKRAYNGDGLASALALFLILKKFNKNADIIIDGFNPAGNYAFLPEIENIKSEAKRLNKTTLNINIAQTGLEDLSYDIKGANLKIYLSPRQGQWEAEDITLANGEFAYDLIIAVDTPELETLGKLYDHHRDLFFQVPLVNIDHQFANEQYGHLNIVDVTAAAVAEIIFNLSLEWLPEEIDSTIATCLLTGLIDKTKSFKAPNVTPQALTAASKLMSLGANRKEIVTRLYQTKTMPILKLWGKILSRLSSDAALKMVWSKADLTDFTDSGSSWHDVPALIEDIITSSPQAETVILIYQTNIEEAKVTVHSQSSVSALALAKAFSPTGDKTQAYFSLSGNLAEIEAKVIAEIKTQLTNLKQV